MVYKVCKVIGCEKPLGTLNLKRQVQRPRQRKWDFCNGCRKGSHIARWPCVDCGVPIGSSILTRIRCDDCNIQYGVGSCHDRYMRTRTLTFHPFNHPERLEIKKFIEKQGDATFTEMLNAVGLKNGNLCGHLRVLLFRGMLIKDKRTGLYTLNKNGFYH